jgi:signal transduction histidine kinase
VPLTPTRSTAPLDERGTAGDLALEIIHEIRNLLEALGYLNFLALSEAKNPEQVKKYLQLAQEQIETLNRIVKQTLGFAQLAAAPKRVDLVDVAEAALRIHQQTIETKKIHRAFSGFDPVFVH